MGCSTSSPIAPHTPMLSQALTSSHRSLGISLDGFEEFISVHHGRERFQGLTTNDVKKIVLAVTKAASTSYASMLLARGSRHVSGATQFVSHVYSARFLDTVDALAAWERGDFAQGGHSKAPQYYYFDVLSVDQTNQKAVVEFEVLRNTFEAGVRDIGSTLLVLDKRMTIMSRLWCVFEMLATARCRASLDIAMSPDHVEQLQKLLSRPRLRYGELDIDGIPVANLFVDLDISRATAEQQKDMDNINRLIVEWGGRWRLEESIMVKIRSFFRRQRDLLFENPSFAALSDSEKHCVWGNFAMLTDTDNGRRMSMCSPPPPE